MPALPDLPLAYVAYLIGTASPGPSVLAVMGTAMAQGRARARWRWRRAWSPARSCGDCRRRSAWRR